MRLNRALGIAVDSKEKLEVTDTSINIDNNSLNQATKHSTTLDKTQNQSFNICY